jgi:hypothetical protein
VRYEYYGYPADFVFRYQNALKAVTKADVLRVAQAHFKPENLAMVTVGNPKDFGSKALAMIGKVTPIDLTIPEPKQEVAAGDAASQARGKALLERAQQAMGGADKLAAIKDLTITVSVAMAPSQGGITVKETNKFAGGQLRMEQDVPGFGVVTVYTDGKSGWMATPQGAMPMPAEVLTQARGELFREMAPLLRSGSDSSRNVNAIGPNTVQISTVDGMSVTLEFDPVTGLPLSQTYREPGQGGAPSQVKETFSDWRDSGGLKAPFKVALEQDGKPSGQATVSAYQINTGLKTEDLAKKP